MTTPPASDERVAHAVRKVRRVPEKHRRFTESTAAVRRVYRIDDALMGRLLDLGLPCGGTADDPRYDAYDLTNIAVSLHLPTPKYVAMRWWPEALTAAGRDGTVRYRVGIRAVCEGKAACDCDDVRIAPELPASGAVVEVAEAGAGGAGAGGSGRVNTTIKPSAGTDVDLRATVELHGSAATVPETYRGLLDLAAAVEWHMLPRALAADVGFVRETGLADCALASRFLAAEAHAAGLRVRSAFGVLVSAPFSSFHQWIEVPVDGAWLPIDPLLLASLAQWGFLDPVQWPPSRSPLGMFWRIDDSEQALVMHGDRHTRVALPTTRIA